MIYMNHYTIFGYSWQVDGDYVHTDYSNLNQDIQIVVRQEGYLKMQKKNYMT